ncbi:hypothetical protein [Pseudomonas sp. URMO17WK12:I11]|uniref:hypothetical protein n=1 Tax=Pseudomonas sp. URMO17WK12:I11 TaxID=1283291 RepID=UPI0007217A14|nr:hypothetical protein [Pseudomonas sp. URMO17WK12:I11]CRL51612.1 hypothetical protein PSHI_48050 [Pseudomonas sp. URMO17WK12:I11]
MKGKRKVKMNQWLLAEQFQVEAQAVLRARTARASRFLDIALVAGRDVEPVGLLAGGRTATSTCIHQRSQPAKDV